MTLAGMTHCTIELCRNFPKIDFVHTSHRAEFPNAQMQPIVMLNKDSIFAALRH
jgi:hypothetical protein